MDDKEEEPPPETPDLPTISNEIDRYISSLESGGDAAPIVMEKFLMLVEEKMDGYDSMESHVKWRRLREEDAAWFLDAVDRVTSLSNSLANLASDYKYAYTINRAGSVVQRAMSYLEGELKVLLEEYTADDADITSDLIRIHHLRQGPVSGRAESLGFRLPGPPHHSGDPLPRPHLRDHQAHPQIRRGRGKKMENFRCLGLL